MEIEEEIIDSNGNKTKVKKQVLKPESQIKLQNNQPKLNGYSDYKYQDENGNIVSINQEPKDFGK